MTILAGPKRFVLAGSGHIAGVVNPPARANINIGPTTDPRRRRLDEFIAGATEHKGSWWPDWIEWLKEQAPKTVKADRRARAGQGQAQGDRGCARPLRQDALTFESGSHVLTSSGRWKSFSAAPRSRLANIMNSSRLIPTRSTFR